MTSAWSGSQRLCTICQRPAFLWAPMQTRGKAGSWPVTTFDLIKLDIRSGRQSAPPFSRAGCFTASGYSSPNLGLRPR